ncbi:MAG: hypothetical protein ABWY25_08465 [Paenisporosarcina sp.]
MFFLLYAFGYPASMGKLCEVHLGPYIAHDQSHGGATCRYIIQITTGGPCFLCEQLKLGSK